MKNRILVTLAGFGLAWVMACVPAKAADYENGSGTPDDPYEIETAEQLDGVRDDLSASYVLTADISLEDYQNWEPLGSFVPVGEPAEGEEMSEVPDSDLAFTGSFDGAGYTVSGLAAGEPGGMTCGLFGCISGAEIRDLTIEGAEVTGAMMTGTAVGYSYNSVLENVAVVDSAVAAALGDLEEYTPDMIGGVVGAAMDSRILGCSADGVEIAAGDVSVDIGLIGGGMEDCTLSGCSAKGSVAAGDDCYGIGGVFGCGFGADVISDCEAEVVITAGARAYLVGGIVGYAGTFDPDEATAVTGCSAAVDMDLGDGAARVGGIVGGGFYFDEYKEYYPVPTSFAVTGCRADGQIVADDGTDIGTYAGNVYMSMVSDVTGELMVMPHMDEDLYPEFAGEDGITYVNLFDVITDEKYDDYWIEKCAELAGDEMAEDAAAMLKSSVTGEIYGEEAVEFYAGGENETRFDCFFIKDAESFTFAPDYAITVKLSDGTEETHKYEYLGSITVGEGEGMVFDGVEYDVAFDCALYGTEDEDAGEFTYFLMRDDTMDSTWHTEFRYGSDLEELKGYFTGSYAYWLAAGIDEEADEETVHNVIDLFITENLGE